MKKLHAMMPMFSEVSAKLETALENKNIVAVQAEAGKLLQSVPDLKKTTPHKNIKQRKKYVELAINSTVSLAQKRDFAGAKAAFRNIENACAACHAKFRD